MLVWITTVHVTWLIATPTTQTNSLLGKDAVGPVGLTPDVPDAQTYEQCQRKTCTGPPKMAATSSRNFHKQQSGPKPGFIKWGANTSSGWALLPATLSTGLWRARGPSLVGQHFRGQHFDCQTRSQREAFHRPPAGYGNSLPYRSLLLSVSSFVLKFSCAFHSNYHRRSKPFYFVLICHLVNMTNYERYMQRLLIAQRLISSGFEQLQGPRIIVCI